MLGPVAHPPRGALQRLQLVTPEPPQAVWTVDERGQLTHRGLLGQLWHHAHRPPV